MARRRVWAALSNSYRTRLLRAGVTQQAYENGASLKAARGHSQTPEKPEEAVRHPGKYRAYEQRVATLQRLVWEKKKRIFGDRFKWDDRRARENLFRGNVEQGIPVVGAETLRKFLAAPDDEWEYNVVEASNLSSQRVSDDWAALFYH